MAIGVLAGALGFWLWYGPVLARSPAWQWPFIPDCPLFALLFVPSLILVLARRPARRYHAWVAFGLIKYGTWTVFVWLAYWIDSLEHFTGESLLMSLSHLGMILVGLVLLSFVRTTSVQDGPGTVDMDWYTVAICVAWYGFSDWMDYGIFRTYPYFDTHVVPLGLVQGHTILMTLSLSVLYAYWARKRHRNRTISCPHCIDQPHGLDRHVEAT
jgi:uncharacterized membrane protein YpjA